MRRAPTRPQNPLLSPVRVLLASAALAIPSTAQAQIEDASPRWVVITKDATPVRCDDFERFYKVATLDTGAMNAGLDVNGAVTVNGTLTANSSTVSATGAWNSTGSVAVTFAGGMLVFDGTMAQTVQVNAADT